MSKDHRAACLGPLRSWRNPKRERLAKMRYLYQVPAGEPVVLDRFLEERTPFGLERVRRLVDFGSVYVDGRVERDPSRVLRPGQKVTLTVPYYGTNRFYSIEPSRILYRDPWILAYDKEPGIPCQPTPHDAHNNLFAALRDYLGRTEGDVPYLALHHRLDRETSGVMLLSLSEEANRALGAAFRERRVEKRYLAVVCADPPEDSWIDERPITRSEGRYRCARDGEKGKEASTEFRVLERRGGLALLEARPKTGRTHQIRVHLADRGLPILGDVRYRGRPFSRLMLHAWSLSLVHPVTGKPLTVEASPPDGFVSNAPVPAS